VKPNAYLKHTGKSYSTHIENRSRSFRSNSVDRAMSIYKKDGIDSPSTLDDGTIKTNALHSLSHPVALAKHIKSLQQNPR